MSFATTDSLPPLIRQSLAEGVLAVPTPDFNYIIPAEKYVLPMHGGSTLRFMRPRPLIAPVVPLGNTGIEPASQVPQRDIIDATVSYYGTSVILNEQVVIQDQDPVLSWVAERLGVAMKEAEDTILREYLLSAVSRYNCRGGSDGDNPADPALSDFAVIGAQLATANAYKFQSGKLGENRFGSAPVRNRFFMLSHTLLQPTFDQVTDFTNSFNYPDRNNALESEYGSVLNISILTSSNASISSGASTNGKDIFNNMTMGRQSFAHIEQDGYSMNLMYRPPQFSGPLQLNSTLGIKFAQAQAITQDTWISNFRCTAAL